MTEYIEPGPYHNYLIRNANDLEVYLPEEYAEDLARTEALLEKGKEFLSITNDDEDAQATEFMVKLRARYKESESSRVTEKTTYDDLAGQVHAFFKKRILDPLGLATARANETFDPVTRTDLGMGPRINMAQTLYKREKAEAERKRREEEARIAREAERAAEAERQRLENAAREAERAAARKRSAESVAKAEAEAAELRRQAEESAKASAKASEERAAAQASASASTADMSRARGERGGVSSLRSFLDQRDLDRDTIDLEILRPYFKDAALEAAVKGWIDANKGAAQTAIKTGNQPIKGVVIFENSRNAGRH